MKELVQNYEPRKSCEAGVEIILILQYDDLQIESWWFSRIIRPSHPNYVSSVVLVKKKDGSTLIWVDYQQLNKKLIKDRYQLLLIEDQFDLLEGARVFSNLDLKNGFFHIPTEKNIIVRSVRLSWFLLVVMHSWEYRLNLQHSSRFSEIHICSI